MNWTVALKAASGAIAVSAMVTGLIAAAKWYEASNVEIDLGYHLPGAPPGGTYKRMGIEAYRTCEPADPILQRMNEICATWGAIHASSQINKIAARWTAVSVALSALAAILGVFD